MTIRTTARTWYLLASLAVALFTIHGSLVPYQFVPRESEEVWEAVDQKLSDIGAISRSDVIANWLLGVPLGFCLLGAFRVDQDNTISTILVAVILFPLCLVLSIGVEFAQLYCPSRMCALSDVLAQAVGVITGYSAWMLTGQRFTDMVRTIALHPHAGGQTGLSCLLYFAFLMLLQILPADLTISPKMLYLRFRHGEITLVPFVDWFQSSNGTRHAVEGLIHLMLCVPLGVGLVLLPGRAVIWRLVIVSFLASVLLEVAQVFVQSRHPSTTEAICGFVGIVLGGLVTLRWTTRS
jgi:glycopeptide antibiotics resistance protein